MFRRQSLVGRSYLYIVVMLKPTMSENPPRGRIRARAVVCICLASVLVLSGCPEFTRLENPEPTTLEITADRVSTRDQTGVGPAPPFSEVSQQAGRLVEGERQVLEALEILARTEDQERGRTYHDPHWPQWRGPLGTGVSPTVTPPVHWDEDLNVRWKVEVPGRGASSPVVWATECW